MEHLPEMLDKPKGVTYQEFIRFMKARNKWEDDWYNNHLTYNSADPDRTPEERAELLQELNKSFNNWSSVELQSRRLENIFLNPEQVCCKNCKHNLVKELDMDIADDDPCGGCVFRRVRGNASLKNLNFEMKNEDNR